MGQASEQGHGEGLLLDTSVCIELLRRNFTVAEALARNGANASYLSTVSLFELLMRNSNLEPAEKLASTFKLLLFDEKAARLASEIGKELRRRGQPIEPADLFIAATAMSNNCGLATLNTKDFLKIKGLKLVKLG